MSAAAAPAKVADASGFYAGKTLKIVVPFAAGGGTDIAARLVASRLAEHIPGKPTVIVENLTGGGGAIGMKEVLEKRPADGLSMVSPAGTLLRWLFKEEGHVYPIDRTQVMGALPQGLVVVVRRDAGDTLEKLMARGQALKMGHAAAGGSGPTAEALTFRMLGVAEEQIYGYKGNGEIAIAIEGGELQGSTPGEFSIAKTFQPMIASNVAVLLFQSGLFNDKGEIVRSPIVKDIPTFEEEYRRVKGQSPSGEMFEAYKVVVTANALNASYLLHPDTPADRLAALGAAFETMAANPKWNEESIKIMDAPAPTMGQQATLTALRSLPLASADSIETLKQAVNAAR